MNSLLDRIAAPYRRDARRDARASLPAYQRGVMLSQPQSYQSLLGVPTMPAPIAPVVGAQQFAQPQVLSAPSPQAQPQRGLLDEIERQPTPAPSLLGRFGGGIRSAAQEIGGLFEGEEGRARAAALSRSLLRGPSRTPISLGQSVAEGLAAGGEEIERMEQRKFAKEQREAKGKSLKMKADFEKEFSEAKTEKEQEAAVSKYLMKSNPLMYRRLKKAESYAQLKARVAQKVIEGEADPAEQKFYDDVIKKEAAFSFYNRGLGMPQADGQVSNTPAVGEFVIEEVKK